MTDLRTLVLRACAGLALGLFSTTPNAAKAAAEKAEREDREFVERIAKERP